MEKAQEGTRIGFHGSADVTQEHDLAWARGELPVERPDDLTTGPKRSTNGGPPVVTTVGAVRAPHPPGPLHGPHAYVGEKPGDLVEFRWCARCKILLAKLVDGAVPHHCTSLKGLGFTVLCRAIDDGFLSR
jgi:hypothetical protein